MRCCAPLIPKSSSRYSEVRRAAFFIDFRAARVTAVVATIVAINPTTNNV